MTTVPQCPPALLPGFSSGLVDSWLDGWTAAADGAVDCVAAIVARGPAALDISRWLELISRRRRPTWATPHEVVFEAPIARLRDFSTSGSRGLVPTLVVPPQAGHDSCIVDYSAQQSQLRTILDSA